MTGPKGPSSTSCSMPQQTGERPEITSFPLEVGVEVIALPGFTLWKNPVDAATYPRALWYAIHGHFGAGPQFIHGHFGA